MTEISTVISHTKHQAVLSCTSAGCSSCAGNSFCNVKAHTYTALNPQKLELEPGDEVEVFLPPGKTIFSGFLVLIFPLILFIAGFLLTGALVEGAGEGLQALGGFIGLTAGFGLGFLFGRLKKSQYMPIIQKKVLS